MVYSIGFILLLLGLLGYFIFKQGGSSLTEKTLEKENETLTKQNEILSNKPLDRRELYSRLRSKE